MALQILVLCFSACLGALARWSLSLWLSHSHTLHYGILAANWIGAYVIGIAIALFHSMPQIDPIWRLAIITGFLGALTTFSSFSAEVVTMLEAQRYGWALATTALHVVGSLVLTVLGMKSFALWVSWVTTR